MNRRNPTPGVTALIAGLTLIAGVAWAQSIEIPIWGTQTVTTVDLGDVFTDANGITHYRGMVRVGQISGQDADGVPITGTAEYVVNINIDMATGDGDTQSKMSTQLTYGDRTGTWRGTADMTFTGFVFDGMFNYARGTGDFRGWHWRGTVTGVFAGELDSWDAIFHVPGGGKAAATKAQTLSAVKNLFR